MVTMLCAILLLATAAVHADPVPSQIVELTEANFGSVTKSKEFMLIDFYSPTCGNSKALAPEFEKAAIMLGKRNVDLAKVDCLNKGKKLCLQYNIKKWPTLKTFRHGVQTNEYFGDHRAEPIAGYVNGAEDVIQENTYYGATFDAATATAEQTKSPAAVSGLPSVTKVAAAPVATKLEVAPIPAKVAATPTATKVEPSLVAAKVEAAPVVAKIVHGPVPNPAKVVVTPMAAAAKAIQGTTVQLPKTSGAGIVVESPEDVIPLAPAAPVSVQAPQVRPAAAASVARLVPLPETLNEMECAKCRILTPVQRKFTQGCKSFKRECILNFHSSAPSIQYAVKMVPGGSGKK